MNFEPTAGRGFKPTPNIGNSLQIKALLFEFDVLSRDHHHDPELDAENARALERKTGVSAKKQIRRPEQLLERGAVDSLLRRELRVELKRRGLDATGKPWVLRARLQEALDNGLEPTTAAISAAEAAGMGCFPTRGIVQGASAKEGSGGGGGENLVGIRAKYGDKLRALKAKAAAREASASAGSGVQASTVLEGGGASGGSSASAWSLNRGAAPLMKYLANRGMRCGLLMPSADTVSDDMLASFHEQLDTQLDDSLTLSREAVHTFPDPDRLLQLLHARGLKPASVMLLTTQENSLRAAREAGCFSSLFLPRNARRPNVRADFTVSDLFKVQDVVEQLNGISWRKPPGH